MENRSVFYYDEFPEEIRKVFDDEYAHEGIGEGKYFEYTLYQDVKPDIKYKGGKIVWSNEDSLIEEGDDIISDWFMEQGIEEIDDTVLILVR